MPELSDIPERVPDLRYHAAWNLITWHPEGVLDNDRADILADFLEKEEASDAGAFNRFTDMDGYTRNKLGMDHVVRLARRRRRYAGPPVKSAFYATRPVSVIIAQLYEELMDGSLIQVCSFRDLAAAAEWLAVPVAILKPPAGNAGEPPR